MLVDQIKQLDVKNFGNVFVAGVHGDGSCLIHAFLYLFSESYRNLSPDEKKIEGVRYRMELGKTLLKSLKSKTKYFQHLADFLNNDVAPFLDKDEFENVAENENGLTAAKIKTYISKHEDIKSMKPDSGALDAVLAALLVSKKIRGTDVY